MLYEYLTDINAPPLIGGKHIWFKEADVQQMKSFTLDQDSCYEINVFLFKLTNFTRCFVIEVTVFQTLLSSEVSSVASFIGTPLFSDVGFLSNFFIPPPKIQDQASTEKFWATNLYNIRLSQVINAYAANDIYVAIKLSNNKTFNFGMSSSFSRAKSALKLATPGHFEGDVQIVVGSSQDFAEQVAGVSEAKTSNPRLVVELETLYRNNSKYLIIGSECTALSQQIYNN
uniref:Uncharacterized protein n=1 Tax=Glossina pallidipes TaxID=7398 RepID=A0A1B0A9X0_GLOPL